MSRKPSLLENESLGIIIFIASVGAPGIFVSFLGDEMPPMLAALLAALTCVPTFFVLLASIFILDRILGRRKVDDAGITGPGIWYAQALVFVYSPGFLDGSEDSEPLLDIGLGSVLVLWAAGGLCAWAGWTVAQRRKRATALAALAQTHPELATRFQVRPDRKSWKTINPANVLAYQEAFEDGLKSVEESAPPERHWSLTAVQLQALASAARRARGEDMWQPTVAGLVLTFLAAPDEEREKQRATWAAYVATGPRSAAFAKHAESAIPEVFQEQG